MHMPAIEMVPEVTEKPKAGAFERLQPGPTESPLVSVQEDLTSVMIGTVVLEADETTVVRENAEMAEMAERAEMAVMAEMAEMAEMTGTGVMLASGVVEELRREDMRSRIGRQ